MTDSKLKTGKWDAFYSTYYWNIYLDRNNPANSTDRLVGYSKRVGEKEGEDKDQLLKRKILNLFINGYFKRMVKIEIFFRTEFVVDKKRDPILVVLYPTYYDIPEANHDVVFKRFGPFLKEFYERLNKHLSMDGILPKSRGIKNPDDWLNIEKQQLPTIAHLYAHASRCVINGHPPGLVNDFVLKYKAIKGW